METIKVLNILPALNFCGGIESYAMSYYRHINRKKIQFDFITHTDLECSFQKEIESYGGVIYKFPVFTIKNLSLIYKMIDKLLFEHNEYKVIHCHMSNAAFIYFYLAKKHGIKIRILHSHNSKYADTFSHSIRNYPLVWLGNLYTTDRLACSKLAGDFLFGKNKYEIVKNAIDTTRFSFNQYTRKRMRKEYCIEDKFVIGHIGRFVPQKNHKFIISLFKDLLKKNNRYVLCLVGDGPLLPEIKQSVNEIKKNVIFCGVKENVEDFYNMFDVFILPSIYEGLGIVNVEAQCTGVKVIASEFVPREVKVTENIQFLPLIKDKWIKQIEQLHYRDRKSMIEQIDKSGYNIKLEAKKLEDIYISKLETYNLHD